MLRSQHTLLDMTVSADLLAKASISCYPGEWAILDIYLMQLSFQMNEA